MKKRIIAIILCLLMIMTMCAGCRKADRVAWNVSREADAFNVVRKITVINARNDEIVYQMEGTFSLRNNSTHELEIVAQTGPNEYKKHFIYLNEWTLYFVEDISGADVNEYRYEVVFYPQQFLSNIEIGIGD